MWHIAKYSVIQGEILFSNGFHLTDLACALSRYHITFFSIVNNVYKSVNFIMCFINFARHIVKIQAVGCTLRNTIIHFEIQQSLFDNIWSNIADVGERCTCWPRRVDSENVHSKLTCRKSTTWRIIIRDLKLKP